MLQTNIKQLLDSIDGVLLHESFMARVHVMASSRRCLLLPTKSLPNYGRQESLPEKSPCANGQRARSKVPCESGGATLRGTQRNAKLAGCVTKRTIFICTIVDYTSSLLKFQVE